MGVALCYVAERNRRDARGFRVGLVCAFFYRWFLIWIASEDHPAADPAELAAIKAGASAVEWSRGGSLAPARRQPQRVWLLSVRISPQPDLLVDLLTSRGLPNLSARLTTIRPRRGGGARLAVIPLMCGGSLAPLWPVRSKSRVRHIEPWQCFRQKAPRA